MKYTPFAFLLVLLLGSCGGESADDIATKWCDLKKKEISASSQEEKKKLREQADAYQESVDKKYRDDEDMRRRIKNRVMECEEELEKMDGEEFNDFDGD